MTREEYNKHKELIEAWSNGAKIQFYDEYVDKWISIENPDWEYGVKYRAKTNRIEFEDCSFNDTEYCVNKFSMVLPFNTAYYNIEDKKCFFKDKRIAEAYAVLPQLIRLRDEYNEGWKSDWESRDSKFSIENFKNNLNSLVSCYSSRILSFKTVEIRDRFLEDYGDLIEIAKPLL